MDEGASSRSPVKTQEKKIKIKRKRESGVVEEKKKKDRKTKRNKK